MTAPLCDASPRRRQVLGALGTGAAFATSGCLDRLQTILGWRSSGRTTVRIKTLPADADPYALRIARQVAEWFNASGLDTRVLPVAGEELRRQVLVNHEFDLFVGRMPALDRSPDALYSLLHSSHIAAPGWQNPFGYSNLGVDDFLERQRRATGSDRRSYVHDIQTRIARSQPFTIAGFPETIRAARTDRFRNWDAAPLNAPAGYLALERASDAVGADGDTVLTVGTTNPRIMEDLNPIAVAFRQRSPILDLVYEPLGRAYAGAHREPWLAASWSFAEGAERPRATVELRPELQWHDGEPLTPADVAFTYEFMADTTGPESEEPLPAPRYQGQSGLVADARAVDERTVELQFVDCSRRVARRAFDVPVLPEHVWDERRSPATIGGVQVSDSVTEAIVTENAAAIGSGPLAVVESGNGRLVLERFADHFLNRAGGPETPAWLADGLAFDRLVVRPAVSESTAVGAVADGTLDAAVSDLGVESVPDIERADELTLLTHESDSCYLVGYNARRSPFAFSNVRHLLGRLIDADHLVESIFDGRARPAATPLAGTDWVPAELAWSDGHPITPFYGSEGELDVDRAKQAWDEAGYRFQDGHLVPG